MELEKMTVSELKELFTLFGGKKKKQIKPKELGLQIVILQRGWVVVGDCTQIGEYIHVSKAAVIRKWGTTEGLPELALKGPLAATVLDKSSDIKYHALTEVFSIKCVEEKWLNKLQA